MPPRPQLDRVRVVLVGTRNPLNIGAAARALSNFGFRRLRLVNPYKVAFRRARSAVGASKILERAEEYKSVADAVADCTLVVGTTAVGQRMLNHPLRRLEHGARAIRQRLASGNVAILFGSEKTGLSNDSLGHCHWLMRIPTGEENISMNLGQAVAVCLYELIRDPSVVRKVEREAPARAREVERITQMLLEAMHTSGFVKPGAASAEEKARRLVRRLNLPARDAGVWMGILRQMLWKMNSVTKAG